MFFPFPEVPVWQGMGGPGNLNLNGFPMITPSSISSGTSASDDLGLHYLPRFSQLISCSFPIAVIWKPSLSHRSDHCIGVDIICVGHRDPAEAFKWILGNGTIKLKEQCDTEHEIGKSHGQLIWTTLTGLWNEFHFLDQMETHLINHCRS